MKEKLYFLSQISKLLTSHISLTESLELCATHSPKKKLKTVFESVKNDVSNGTSLWQSLHPYSFSEAELCSIRIGEENGLLASNISYVVEDIKKSIELKRKIISAFIYPLIIGLCTIALSLFLIGYVFPKVKSIFASMKTELPATTKLVIFLSDMLTHYWYYLLLFAIIFTATTIYAWRIEKIKFTLDSLLLRMPIMGNLIKHYNTAVISRTVSHMLDSGLTLTEALSYTTTLSSNTCWQKMLSDVHWKITQGKDLSLVLEEYKEIVPEFFPSVISIAERTGSLSTILHTQSLESEHTLDTSTKRLSVLIEPILMCTMGLVVGFISLSIISPIYAVTSTFK